MTGAVLAGVRLLSPLIGVDWLNGTFPVANVGRVVEALSRHLGTAEQGPGKGWYPSGSWRFVSGAIVAWSDKRPEAWVSINGDSLELVECVHGLMRDLQACGLRCSRLDVALDLPRELLELADVGRAALARQVVGCPSYRAIHETAAGTGEKSGEGHYFGKRGKDGSGRYVRFYDKGLESGGELDCVRAECEFSAEHAAQWFGILCDEEPGSPGFVRALGRAVGGCIDFREHLDSASDVHVERRPRVGWWQRILDIIGQAKIRVPRPVVPLQRTLEYVKQAFSQAFGRAVLAAEAQFGGDVESVDLVTTWLQGVVQFGVNKVRALGKSADALSARLDFGRLFSDPAPA